MAPNSAVIRRRVSHDLTLSDCPRRDRPHRTRSVDDAEHDCCGWKLTARRSRALHSQSDTCMQRPLSSWASSDCEEKRDPDERHRSHVKKHKRELDPNARLEKRSVVLSRPSLLIRPCPDTVVSEDRRHNRFSALLRCRTFSERHVVCFDINEVFYDLNAGLSSP